MGVGAAVQREEWDGEPGRQNVGPVAVQREESDGEPGRQNGPVAVQDEGQVRGSHEAPEPLHEEHQAPSVFQAVLIRSLLPAGLRSLPRRLLMPLSTWGSPAQPTKERIFVGSVPQSERHKPVAHLLAEAVLEPWSRLPGIRLLLSQSQLRASSLRVVHAEKLMRGTSQRRHLAI